jgi:HNH endonuclease/AP2 domain
VVVKTLPDIAHLRTCFTYEPETGILRWAERPRSHFPTQKGYSVWRSQCFGKPAGSPNSTGHKSVGMDGTSYLVHRIIWFMMTGEQPPVIDHINGDPTDNRWANLREATHKENIRNQRRHKGHRGLKGVTIHRGKIVAQIMVNRKHIYLGRFATVEEAHEAYCRAAHHYFGKFSNTG